MKKRKLLHEVSQRHLRRLASLESQRYEVLSVQKESDQFDSSLLNICPNEASTIDPCPSNSSNIHSAHSSSNCAIVLNHSEFLENLQSEDSVSNSESSDLESGLEKIILPNDDEDFVRPLFSEELSSWAVHNNINHTSLTSLLKLLKKNGHPDLPSDARTLLCTPRITTVREVHPGSYWHGGLKNALASNLMHLNLDLDNIESIELSINIDGLPISRSSGSSLWPILGSIAPSNSVFLIGVYHGITKPASANNFLEEFVTEFQEIAQTGIQINNKHLSVELKCLVFDAPAKAFILSVKGHGGYSSCTKCTVEGENVENRMCFNDLNAPKRKDVDFRLKNDEEYHMGETILVNIEHLGLVTNVPLDYMHLVCLGVVRKMMYMWVGGDLKVRLPSQKVKAISKKLETIKDWTAKEFVRKPRSLTFLKQWKATEFRQFLLYSGPIVLQGLLPRHMYNHFMTLSVAVRILCSPNFIETSITYAEELLRHFVESFKMIYGHQHISHNVHGLIHLCDDVRTFGALDNFSAFKYENYLQSLKKLIRKSERPLQQICRRYYEIERNFSINPKKSMVSDGVSGLHYNGPVTDNTSSPQYQKLRLNGFCLDTNSKGNNCCMLTDDTVVFVKNIAFSKNSEEMVILGHNIKITENVFENPCNSSILNIYKASNTSKTLRQWPVSKVRGKCVVIPMEEDEYGILPVIHCESQNK